jgi:hypothetical protein
VRGRRKKGANFDKEAVGTDWNCKEEEKGRKREKKGEEGRRREKKGRREKKEEGRRREKTIC